MALAQIYTAIGGDTITAARWNNEFGNIYTNGTDVSFPVTKAVSFAGFTVTLDAAGVTTISSSSSQAFQLSPGSKSGTPGINGSFLNLVAATFTDTNTAGSGTAIQWTNATIRRPTLAASNALVTTTDAASFYIENSPLAGSNETITNSWALWIDAGNVRFDENIYWLSGTAFQGILDHNNSAHRTYTFQDSNDTIVGRATTDTLTNKTITSPVLNGTYTLGGTPTVPASTGASLVFIESIDLTSVNTVINLGSTYDEHIFQLVDVRPTTTNRNLLLTYSIDNGSTFGDSSYFYMINGVGTSSATSIVLVSGATNDVLTGISGHVRLFKPQATSKYKQVIFDLTYMDTSVVANRNAGSGFGGDNSPDVITNAVNAVKFAFSSASTTASGTLRHYGVKNS